MGSRPVEYLGQTSDGLKFPLFTKRVIWRCRFVDVRYIIRESLNRVINASVSRILKTRMMLCGRMLGPSARANISRVKNRGLHSIAKIGNREVVGFGFNGEPNYMDRTDFPFPAIRFVENSPEVMVSRGGFRSPRLNESIF